MNEIFEGAPVFMVVIVSILLFVLALLWFFLPFMVYGINEKMKELLRQARKTNDLLAGKAPRP